MITARGWYKNAEEVTKRNLLDYDIPFDELIICGLEEDKGKFLSGADRYILSLEDNPGNHLIFKTKGVENPYCIYRKPFDHTNVQTEELIRCHSEIKI